MLAVSPLGPIWLESARELFQLRLVVRLPEVMAFGAVKFVWLLVCVRGFRASSDQVEFDRDFDVPLWSE